MIEAVIFDFGGVITTSPFDAFARHERERGLPAGFLRGVNATNPADNAWARFERAQIDADAFDAAFAAESEALGHRVAGREVIALLSGDIRPRMVAALDACKARFKLGCLTNNVPTGHGAGMSATAEKARAVAAVMARFDAVVESSKAGVRKPDPAIYRLICEALGVAPSACVYLDDLGINCKPAAELGMTAIKVTGEDQALADLEAATGLDLRGGGMSGGHIGAQAALAQLDGWAAADGRDAIVKTFRFADFNAAFGWMTRVALAADKMDHHPEWSNVYATVEVLLATHDADGVTDKDVALARFMDHAAG